MFDYLGAHADEKYCLLTMYTKAREKEPFVKLEWAPDLLTRSYPPMYLDCAEAASRFRIASFVMVIKALGVSALRLGSLWRKGR